MIGVQFAEAVEVEEVVDDGIRILPEAEAPFLQAPGS